jgi:rod shape-determining protein MreC
MESVLGRYRNLTILVGVLFLQVLGLAVQVKRSADAEHTRLIRIWAVDLVTPFERGLVWVQNGSSNLWHNYFFLRGVRAENRDLKEQIQKMQLEQVRLNEDATQAHRLQALLEFKGAVHLKTVPAQVIGSSGSDLSRSIYIDKGDNAGLKPDMAVITAGGIVGKVWIVYPSTSLVLMINDQSSGVGAMMEKSRLQGVVRGTPNGELILDRVMSDESVAPGETLLSSGGDRIFPKGLPVGMVSKVSTGHDMFLNIQVKPAADLSRVEEVLVVTEKQEREPDVAETGSRMRAADILAQRLPSVPDKPAVVAGAPPPANGGNSAAGRGANAGVTPRPNGSAKPLAATGPAGTRPGSTAADAPLAGRNASNPGGTESTAAGQAPTSTDASKKAVPKTAPSDSENDSGSKSAAAGGNSGSASNSTTNSTNKSANPKDKPATQQQKATSPPASPQPKPPATEDSPH